MKDKKTMGKYSDTKIFKGAIALIAIIFILIKIMLPSEEERVLKRMEKHLKKEYQEELVITHLGGYRGKYIGTVLAKKYEGTSRQYDSFVRAEIIVDGSAILDHYQAVISREELVSEESPKLKEIFGENVLPIFDRVTEGAIYIFGSIENEKDIKKYKEGIFEYVQHLKSVDNFEFVKLAFIVIDERVLEDHFYDLNIKSQLIEAKEESKTEKEFLAKREKIMSQIKITSTDKSERIEGINRGDLRSGGSAKYFGHTVIAGTTIISTKMLESDPLYKKMNKTEIGKTYDKLEEVFLSVFTSKYLKRRN